MRPAFEVGRSDDGVRPTGHQSRIAHAHAVAQFRGQRICQVALEAEGEPVDAEVAARQDDVVQQTALRFDVEAVHRLRHHRRQVEVLVHLLNRQVQFVAELHSQQLLSLAVPATMRHEKRERK